MVVQASRAGIPQSPLSWHFAIVGTAYGFWMLYASGVDQLLISTVLYLPGIAVFAIGKRERGEKIFSYSYELFLAVALAVLALLYVIRLL